VVIDGPKSGVYSPGGVRVAEIRLTVDRDRRTICATLPKGAIPGSPKRWGFVSASFSPDAGRTVLDLVGGEAPPNEANPRTEYITPLM
jgi:hypothetical protein